MPRSVRSARDRMQLQKTVLQASSILEDAFFFFLSNADEHYKNIPTRVIKGHFVETTYG